MRKISSKFFLLGGVLFSLLLSGCNVFGPYSTLEPHSEVTHLIDRLYKLTIVIDAGILVLVFGLIGFVVIKYRRRHKDQQATSTLHSSLKLELLWTIVPALLLLMLAIPTWATMFAIFGRGAESIEQAEARGETLAFVAVGHQWWWEYKYPDLDLVAAGDAHLPVDTLIDYKTTSVDVIHSFWVPQLLSKIDSLPGAYNGFPVVFDEEGIYEMQCAEFCGTQHAQMRGRIIVESREKFDAWVARQKLPPEAVSQSQLEGQVLFTEKACVTCHTIEGVPGAVGNIGPRLNALIERTKIGAGIIPNSMNNLTEWIYNTEALKPGTQMVLPFPVSQEEARKIAAFLLAPPGELATPQITSTAPVLDEVAVVTDSGEPDAARGKALYMAQCFACHGPDPTKDGPIGPAISNSSVELILARTTYGNVQYNKSYPEGYKPKRNTRLMAPIPSLKEADIKHIQEYLKQ